MMNWRNPCFFIKIRYLCLILLLRVLPAFATPPQSLEAVIHILNAAEPWPADKRLPPQDTIQLPPLPGADIPVRPFDVSDYPKLMENSPFATSMKSLKAAFLSGNIFAAHGVNEDSLRGMAEVNFGAGVAHKMSALELYKMSAFLSIEARLLISATLVDFKKGIVPVARRVGFLIRVPTEAIVAASSGDAYVPMERPRGGPLKFDRATMRTLKFEHLVLANPGDEAGYEAYEQELVAEADKVPRSQRRPILDKATVTEYAKLKSLPLKLVLKRKPEDSVQFFQEAEEIIEKRGGRYNEVAFVSKTIHPSTHIEIVGIFIGGKGSSDATPETLTHQQSADIMVQLAHDLNLPVIDLSKLPITGMEWK